MIPVVQPRRLPEKAKQSAEPSGAGEDEEAKAGDPTLHAVRKTKVRRDGGKRLSS